eukprot:3045053-Rhodomonas_salina.2
MKEANEAAQADPVGANPNEEISAVAVNEQRLWTSVSTANFDGDGEKELCNFINGSMGRHLRTDSTESLQALPWPESSRTFRGAILPEEHLEFYSRMRAEGSKYRVPGFLATS